ncbi:MAG: sulfite exporter TauE/SafE family protein [Saprospiraceae bacterium]|nr:sulfite exporter TauE/SafE family protein [Saprospiraceae bacterium]
MDIWTAFLIGFIGSFHCIGMCGPIALSLPYQDVTKAKTAANVLLYNSGRVVTYSFIGLVFGLIGQGIALAGFQQWLSIGLGVLMLLAAFSVVNFEKQLVKIPLLDTGFKKVRFHLGRLLAQKSQKKQTLFLVGVLNGFLPCGLVYLAIVGSIATGDVFNGSLYMAIFGIGTIPMMLSVALIGNLVSLKFRKNIQKIIPYMLGIMAVLLILRGMNLGIPYLSPELIQDNSDIIAPICH